MKTIHATMQGDKGEVVCKGTTNSGILIHILGLNRNLRIIFNTSTIGDQIVIFEIDEKRNYKELFRSTR